MNSNKVVALYLRISDEDTKLALDEESNSITSQRELLTAYIKNHEDLSQFPLIEMLDDGYSGTNFERPGIKALIEQAQAGIIEAILVKDFSRFGRNYIEVGNYVEQIFPFLGVRFIAVSDDFDSNNKLDSVGALSIGLKSLIHDLYSKDLSEKITSVRKSKAEQGKFITGYAPYGLQKTQEQRLIADVETAPIVKRIFQMALEGTAKSEIAKILNREGIPSPLMLRKLRKQHFPCNHVNEVCHWTTAVIHAMLKDQRYVGDSVYGKSKPTVVGSGKDKQVPKEDWIIVADAFEPIIERDLFEKVQKMGKTHNYQRSNEVSIFSGKIRCGCCHHLISRQVKRGKTGEKVQYRCMTKSTTSQYNCYQESVSEKAIEMAILESLKDYIKMIETPVLKKERQESTESHCNAILREMVVLEQLQKKIASSCLENYEAYKAGRIDKQAFMLKKNTLEEKIKVTQDTLRKKKIECIPALTTRCETEEVSDEAENFLQFEGLTRKIVEIFVDCVTIKANGAVNIKWNFNQPF